MLRALERLDRFALQTAEALAVAPDPASGTALLGLMAGDAGDETVAAALPRALATLREQALVWGDDERLRLVRTARELLAPSPQHPSPTGLGPTVHEAASGMSPGRIQEIVTTAGLASTHDSVSAVTALTALFTHRKKMAKLLSGAPEGSLEVLSRLVWGPPYGQVTPEPAAHLRWLLDRGLLLPTAPGTVVLPREVALHLRAGRAHREPEPLPPAVEPAATHRPQGGRRGGRPGAHRARHRRGAAEGLGRGRARGAAGRRAQRARSQADRRRPGHVRAGRRVLGRTGLCGGPVGLRRRGRRAVRRHPLYDEWLERPPAERWALLAGAWLTATRAPGLVGGRDAKDRTLSALGPGLDRSAAPEVRHRVLTLLAGLPAGAAPAPESILTRLHWERPCGAPRAPPPRPGHPRRGPPHPPRPLDPRGGGTPGRDGTRRAVHAGQGAAGGAGAGSFGRTGSGWSG